MVKLVTERNCDILDSIFVENSFIRGIGVRKTKQTNSFISYITNFKIEEGNVFLGCEITDAKVYNIVLKLAQALDENSVSKIKILKREYSAKKELLKAREYLNRISKQIFDVYSKDYDAAKVPAESMRALGISNIPALDFLLLNSLTYYEKDGGTTTVDTICAILKNKNLNYSFEDIYNYLRLNKNKIKYNQITTNYLVQKLNYDKLKIEELGIVPQKSYTKEKIKDYFINLKKAFKKNFVPL